MKKVLKISGIILAVILVLGGSAFFYIRYILRNQIKSTGFTLSDLTGIQESEIEMSIQEGNEEDSIVTKEELLIMVMSAYQKNKEGLNEEKQEEREAEYYIQLAENEGIITVGEISTESETKPVTRIEGMSVIALCDFNMGQKEKQGVDFLPFDDIEMLTESEIEMISHLTARGIIQENPYGVLRPYDFLTSKELSEMLSSLFQ